VFADGALLPAPTLARLDPGDFPQVVLRWRPGADVTRAEARIRTISGAPVSEPVRPPEIERLLQVDDLPVILAGFLALLAVVGVGHSVVTNATRRRRDLALLETLGFRTRQVTGTIASHAVTIAILGLVVGIPAGVLVGRLAWRAVAHSVGIDPAADVPALLVLATVPASLVVVLLMSVYPARQVARIRPAVALRSE
jgi:predicted lysophospholipase L1 biosynthesis ABC-type transport system permease subunit